MYTVQCLLAVGLLWISLSHLQLSPEFLFVILTAPITTIFFFPLTSTLFSRVSILTFLLSNFDLFAFVASGAKLLRKRKHPQHRIAVEDEFV